MRQSSAPRSPKCSSTLITGLIPTHRSKSGEKRARPSLFLPFREPTPFCRSQRSTLPILISQAVACVRVSCLKFFLPILFFPDLIARTMRCFTPAASQIVSRPPGRDHSLIKVSRQGKVAPLITKGGLKSDGHNLSIRLKSGPVGTTIQIAK